LYKKDSALGKQLFQDAQTKYQSFQSELTQKTKQITGHKEYIPLMDTLVTSLHFLEKNNLLKDNKSIQQTLGDIKGMESRFQQAAHIQQYLSNRKQYLKVELGKLGMLKELKKYNKQVYYYNAQIEEYKSILKEPKKIERKAIDLLSKTKPFKDFMNKYSILGSLFQTSGSSAIATNQPVLPGAQTRTQVNALIQQAIAGPNNSMQVLQSNIQQAQGQIQQLKNRINEAGGSSDDELPAFRPNTQKVKSFWNRLELGSNLQSTRSNNWIPSATQIGLSAGYKLNDKSIIGMGIAGSIGWGKDIRHIAMSFEGTSARSYLDWKIKRTFWISAAFEMNYRQAFTRIEQLRMLNAWQQSGLIGICKKYQVSKKFKGRMSLLWDYLSYQQIPRTQPLIFRFGYSIK
jgi:hypothetical protein